MYVGRNLVCDNGGISNHQGKCGIFDKWYWATGKPYGKKTDPCPPPIKHKNKSPMD